jgi:hypothetical protein
MTDLIQKLEDFFDSDVGKKSVVEFNLRQERLELHEQRWVEKMWYRIQNNIDDSIQRLLNWYNSDKYRNREYRMSYEPRESLLWVLFDVAKKYGNDCTEHEIEEFTNIFTGEIMRIGSYVIQVMHGQGSVIKIDKI